MNRQEKEQVIQNLVADFNASQAAFLIAIKGMTVNQIQQLRRGLRKNGGRMSVVKNTLARRVAHDIGHVSVLEPYMKDQVALVFSAGEPPAIAKTLWDVARKADSGLQLIAGCYESRLFDAKSIEFLATLPSREVLLARLCGSLKAPLSQPVSIMHQVVARLLYVLKQASEKNLN